MQKNTSSLRRDTQPAWVSTNSVVDRSGESASLIRQSAVLGGIVGEIGGALIGTVTGSLTLDLTGTLMGFTAGVILGALVGTLVGMVVGKIAGEIGGPSIGAYTGMGTGALLGAIYGYLMPDSIRFSSILMRTPMLETLASSRFETIAFFAFLVCLLGTAVGVWVAGKNYRPGK